MRGRQLQKKKGKAIKSEEDLIWLLDTLVTAILIVFLLTLAICLVCRKRIRQPVFDSNSQFMQSFIEDGSSTRESNDLQPLKDDCDEEEEDKRVHDEEENDDEESMKKELVQSKKTKGSSPKKVELEMS